MSMNWLLCNLYGNKKKEKKRKKKSEAILMIGSKVHQLPGPAQIPNFDSFDKITILIP